MLENVQGQEEGVEHLRRVVNGSSTSPLLLVGPKGVGKRYSVLEAIKEVFKETQTEEACPQCYQLNKGLHPDFRYITSTEGKDIKVDDVRKMLAEAVIRPSRAPWKALVIDGADCMTPASGNALLKVLEESPDTVRFFLLAEDKQRILPTILSRCVEARYRRLPESFVVKKLCELTSDSTKALVYCRLSGGSVGRAAKLLGSGRLGVRDRMIGLLKTGTTGDLPKLVKAVDDIGSDLSLGLLFLEHIVYDLVMLPHSTTFLSNLDIVSDLRNLREDMGEGRISKLRSELTEVLPRRRGPYNLAFNVKSMMASVFS